MSKVIIDIPGIGYQTWCITSGYVKDGKFFEDSEDGLLNEIKKSYPYNEKNKHVF